MKRVWAHACVRKAMSLVLLVSCPRGQEVNTQAAPGTLIRQHCWQGSGWPGSPGPALALGWPGTLEGSEGALGEHSGVWRENTVGCGGLAVSSQRVGPAIFAPPSSPPDHSPLCFTTSHRLGSVCMDGAGSWDALAPLSLSPASWGLGDCPLVAGAGSSPCPRLSCLFSLLGAD